MPSNPATDPGIIEAINGHALPVKLPPNLPPDSVARGRKSRDDRLGGGSRKGEVSPLLGMARNQVRRWSEDSKTVVLLAGDRGFESLPLRRSPRNLRKACKSSVLRLPQ